VILVTLVAVAALYGYGLARAKRRGFARQVPAISAFATALLVAAAVLLGPMDELADASLSWHMVQHLALAFIVAPLLLLGAPLRLAFAALPTCEAARLARALRSRPARLLTHPAFAWLQFTGALYLAHFTALYETALERPPVHALEHALFVASALLFWTPVLAVAPAPHAPAHGVRLLMLFLALPMSAFLGFIFYVQRGPLYPHYAAHRGALKDQANAGAVMWITGGGPLVAALLWCVADWGARERRLGIVADRLEST
jgi:putative copper resistance protein D